MQKCSIRTLMLLHQGPLLCKQKEVILGKIKYLMQRRKMEGMEVGTESQPAFCSFSNLVN